MNNNSIKFRIKEDQGSILIESAIIYPIIIIVIFLLISVTLVLHDRYITEMTVRVNAMSLTTQSDDVLYSVQNTELANSRIGTTDRLKIDMIQSQKMRNEKIAKQILIKDETKYFLSDTFIFNKAYTVDLYPFNGMKIMYKTELVSDIFDTVEVTKTIKDAYYDRLDAIFNVLESY